MKIKKKAVVCIALAAMMTISLPGCGRKDKNATLETGTVSDNSVVMLVGNEPVRFSEIKDYCYFLKCQYEGNFGEELWNYPIGDSETIGDQAKQEIVNMITQLKIICAKAKEENITLTADEQDEALRQAEELVANATKKDKKEYKLSVQELTEIYKENALASKMFYIATDDADTNISDEQARQVSLQYVQILTNGTNKNGVQVKMDEQTKKKALKRAIRLAQEAARTEDFLTFAQQNTEAQQAELTIGRDTDKLEKTVVDAAFSMQTGEISEVIEGEQGYYILYCVNQEDEEATRQRKEEIIQERQTAMFMDKYSQWMQGKKVDINQSFWNEFSI